MTFSEIKRDLVLRTGRPLRQRIMPIRNCAPECSTLPNLAAEDYASMPSSWLLFRT